MSKNIKEIGKELLGKSLNSFHRKTGLTQLEKNNEMQDGVLDGILSQVDDAYIEKTEQSNVIHLDGSGDGVVVVDSIEGDTMVNLCRRMNSSNTQWILNNGWWELNKEGVLFLDFEVIVKPSTLYTVIMNTKLDNSGGIVFGFRKDNLGWNSTTHSTKLNGVNKFKFTTSSEETNRFTLHRGTTVGETTTIGVKDIMILEGDWTNKEIPASYFEGLQSSFENKVNDEGKYEIEILCNNKSLIDWNIENLINHKDNQFDFSLEDNAIKVRSNFRTPYQFKKGFYVKEGEKYTIQIEGRKTSGEYSAMYMGGEDLCYPKGETYILVPAATSGNIIDGTTYGRKTVTMIARKSGYVDRFNIHSSGTGNFYWIKNIYLEKGETVSCIPHKSNKIKVLLDSPLLKGDKLVIKDGKLCHYHRMGKDILNGNENWSRGVTSENYLDVRLNNMSTSKPSSHTEIGGICNVFPYRSNKNGNWIGTDEGVTRYPATNGIILSILKTKLPTQDIQGFKQWLQINPIELVYELAEPYYEEVLNEYGEPIILEGYENGTLYIDSTVIPTTTVRYTPKMESFKTLKEVNKNNNLITLDINENIIPYMMDVDYMIMEKELCLLNTKNIRKMEELDMTSMQKRTQDMLERLIKGKTLTEQECKTRVTTYLNAGKITDEQAEELMLVISEVYA